MLSKTFCNETAWVFCNQYTVLHISFGVGYILTLNPDLLTTKEKRL